MKFCDFAYDLHYAESPPLSCLISSFFFNDTATTEIYTLSLHDALPIGPLAPDGDLLLASTQPVRQGAKGGMLAFQHDPAVPLVDLPSSSSLRPLVAIRNFAAAFVLMTAGLLGFFRLLLSRGLGGRRRV